MRKLLSLATAMVFPTACADKPEPTEQPSPMAVLETAISDVGYWRWWTSNTSGVFQVEFGGVQLFNEPTRPNSPPSSLIALRFSETRYVAALRRQTGTAGLPGDWFDLLAKDEIEPPTVAYEEFTLTSMEELKRIVRQATDTHLVVGTEVGLTEVHPDDAFLAFWAGDVGIVIVAGEMEPVTQTGTLTPEDILAKYSQWWDYWREYWKRKDSDRPMPQDYACEVTIPLKE